MRLESAHIKNFKLLENVILRFSNDLLRPLTVIRAENGSGKLPSFMLYVGQCMEKGDSRHQCG